MSGTRCPYVEHSPTTQEGFELLDILERHGSLFEFYPSGKVAGFNVASILGITEVLGYDKQAMLLLLCHAQQGLLEAIKDIDQKASTT